MKVASDASGGTAGDYRCVSVKRENLAYIWIPSALYFADRADRTLISDDMLTEQSLAKQVYSRVNFGSMLIDDDYSMVLVLDGNIVTTIAAA